MLEAMSATDQSCNPKRTGRTPGLAIYLPHPCLRYSLVVYLHIHTLDCGEVGLTALPPFVTLRISICPN
jgi:hypothetical protein